MSSQSCLLVIDSAPGAKIRLVPGLTSVGHFDTAPQLQKHHHRLLNSELFPPCCHGAQDTKVVNEAAALPIVGDCAPRPNGCRKNRQCKTTYTLRNLPLCSKEHSCFSLAYPNSQHPSLPLCFGSYGYMKQEPRELKLCHEPSCSRVTNRQVSDATGML